MTDHGLPKHTTEAILQVLGQYPEIQKAILYGSRAKGNYRPGSDIDLSLVGPELETGTLFRIETALDDLLLPYHIDLSILHHIDNPGLLEHIQRVGQVFYEADAAARAQ